MYWFSLACAALFLGWAHTHTDEIPVVLGLIFVVCVVVGALFPTKYLFTGAVLGIAIFCAETMVHLGVLHAPYPASINLPWPALTGFVPAVAGTALGVTARKALPAAH